MPKQKIDKKPNLIHIATESNAPDGRGAWAFVTKARRGHFIYQTGTSGSATQRGLMVKALASALGRLPGHEGEVAVYLPDEALAEELRSGGAPSEVSAPQESFGVTWTRRRSKLAFMIEKRPIRWMRAAEADEACVAEARRLAAEAYRGAFGEAAPQA